MMLRRKFLHTFMTFYFEALPKVPIHEKGKEVFFEQKLSVHKKYEKQR